MKSARLALLGDLESLCSRSRSKEREEEQTFHAKILEAIDSSSDVGAKMKRVATLRNAHSLRLAFTEGVDDAKRVLGSVEKLRDEEYEKQLRDDKNRIACFMKEEFTDVEELIVVLKAVRSALSYVLDEAGHKYDDLMDHLQTFIKDPTKTASLEKAVSAMRLVMDSD